jgi:acetate kinase
VLVDETVISELEKLETVEPSHQPFEVDAIRAIACLRAPAISSGSAAHFLTCRPRRKLSL